MRNIHKNCKTQAYSVIKYFDGKNRFFGSYPTIEVAKIVRDKLIDCNWDETKYQSIRNELRSKGVKL